MRKGRPRRQAALSRGMLRALLGSTVLIAASAAQAQDATWLASPGSNDPLTGANWSTGTAPGSGNTAFFGPSDTTALTVGLGGWQVGGITLNANAAHYTFDTADLPLVNIVIYFDGAGFNVNGGSATVNMSGNAGLIFANGSSAGTSTINNTAANSRFGLMFQDSSSAGNATITTSAGGFTAFLDSSTAGNATITTTSSGSITGFGDTSTAGHAIITTSSGAVTNFGDSSTADNATITTSSGAVTNFLRNSTAGNATITTQAGAGTVFYNSSAGGTSRHIIDAGGFVDVSAHAGAITLGSIEGAGTVKLGANSLSVGSNDLSTTFSGDLAGTSARFTKIGNGTLTLTGTSHTYGGDTTVNGGTLAVNGSIANSSGVIVNSGATLGGTGTVPTVTINSGGTLAPGNSIGTLNVAGTLTFNAGATYAVEVSPAAADKTAVSGTASLTGGTVQATFQAGSYLTKHYTILTSAGLGGTRFAGLDPISLPAHFNAALGYTSTNVTLDLTSTLSTLPGDNLAGNQPGVANTLNNFFNNGGALPPGFLTLFGLTGHALGNGLDQASGQGSSGGIQAAFNAAGQFMTAITDPSSGGAGSDGGAGGYGDEAMAYAGERSQQARDADAAMTPRDRRASFEGRWSVWAAGYGGSSVVNGDAGAGTQSTTSRVYGTAVGADYRLGGDIRLGFAMGGAGTNFNTAGGLGGGGADLLQFGVHGRREIGPAYVSGALAYGWQDVTTDRTVTIAGTDHLRAHFDTSTFATRAEAGYRLATALMGVTPYAALQATAFHLPSHGEAAVSGSNQFALAFSSQTTTNVRSELGLRSDKTFAAGDGTLTLRGRAAWSHDSNTDRIVTPTFQSLPGSSSFTVNGARPSPDGALLTAGAEMNWRNGWSLAGSFEGEFSRTTESYAGKGTVRYAW